MKKKAWILLILIIIIPVVYYNYPRHMDKKLQEIQFNKLEVQIYTVGNIKNYTTQDQDKIDKLYKYISSQRGYKCLPWYGKGSYSFDERYVFDFVNSAALIHCSIYKEINDWYIELPDFSMYRLDKKTFDTGYIGSLDLK
jgi:hypothetical protein